MPNAKLDKKNAIDLLADENPKVILKAIELISKEKSHFEPILLKAVEFYGSELDILDEEDSWKLTCFVYILAYWKTKQAFDLFLKIFSISDFESDEYFGDVVPQSLSFMLLRTWNENLEGLQRFIANEENGEIVRITALTGFAFIAYSNPDERKHFKSFCEGLLRDPDPEDTMFNASLVENLSYFGDHKSHQQIQLAFYDGLIDEREISLEDIAANFGSDFENLLLQLDFQHFDSVEQAMGWMQMFNQSKKR